MRITRRQLRRLIKEELCREGLTDARAIVEVSERRAAGIESAGKGFEKAEEIGDAVRAATEKGLEVAATFEPSSIAAYVIENHPLTGAAKEYWDNMDPTVKKLLTTMRDAASKLPGAAKESAKAYVISIIEGL